MGVQCQILINKAKEGVFRPGQAVKGKIRYLIDEPTEYQDVNLSFIGKGKCVWSQGSNKNRRTYRGKENYIVSHVNICNKRPEETITLHGKYEHPFEFFLPENIPGTYKDYIGHISYRVELKFVKPSFFSFKKVFTAEVPVYSYLSPTSEGPIIFGLQKELFAPFATQTPVVNLKAEINKTCLVPGENAQLSFVVTNDSDVEITSVRTELYRYTTYTADCGTKKHVSSKVDNCEAESRSVSEKQVCDILCVLPTLPELYSIQHSSVIEIEYRVKVTVRLPLPHFNATVELPVLIGEVKGEVTPAVEVNEDEPLDVADGDEPPSYWEAMNDKEGKKSDLESD